MAIPPATLFVSGTDTDVGKSVVTACLAAARPGSLAVKPVASGVEAGHGEDAELLARGGGHAPHTFATYRAPLSPHRASAMEGKALDVPGMLAWIDALEGSPVLVEGVGGWRVPLTLDPRFDLSDLAIRLGAPVVVVAADRLGVLNHTLLTVEAISVHLPVAGVVLNQGLSHDSFSLHTEHDLNALLDVPVVCLGPVDLHDVPMMARAGKRIWEVLAC